MANTQETFRQITELLEAGHSQTAYNLFAQTLREANVAGYEQGRSDEMNCWED